MITVAIDGFVVSVHNNVTGMFERRVLPSEELAEIYYKLMMMKAEIYEQETCFVCAFVDETGAEMMDVVRRFGL